MIQADDVIKEFLVESCENLDRIDRELISLEQNPDDRSTLASIFRAIHSIKGTCGFLGFGRLEAVSHVGENLLSKLRDGELRLNADMTSALLSLVDAIRQMLGSIESLGNDGEDEYPQLVATLTRLQTPGADETGAEAGPTAEAVDDSPANAWEAAMAEHLAASETLVAEAFASESSAATTPAQAEPPRTEQASPGKARTPSKAPSGDDKQAEHRSPSAADNNIRVDVSLLDKLMNLVGELVLARNQILQFTATMANPLLMATSQRLNLITTELQEGVMKTRMQPIGNIWSKFPRVVRDLSLSCGKQVRVEMEGKETELDKTIIEAIKDPLTHIVRNSVDHGIERPEAREAAGKPSEGRLFLRAYHEGGQVNIEISDDGGGIHPEKVRNKAVQKGLISVEQAARMSDRDSLGLIFLPGFSTAEKVTNVSGRGVGMDVVKTNIEKIGGSVDIHSRQGEGTSIKIKIPLTLAIIPALRVTCGGARYAIPQVSLLELLRLERKDAVRQIEKIHGSPVYRLRGRLLPLVDLRRELQMAEQSIESRDGRPRQDDAVNIVVLQADERQFGLIVDTINDTGEIVVKPLSKQLKGLSVYAGATILGDGQVALILDVLGLAQRANVVTEARDRGMGDGTNWQRELTENHETLLLFQTHQNERAAIPLSSVARLEEFARSAVERCGDQEVVQYRGQIMPLVHASTALSSGYGGFADEGDPRDRIQVVVYSHQGRSVGFVVQNILDIVQEDTSVRGNSHRRGVLAQLVIQGKVTELLDIQGLLRDIDPTLFDPPITAA